MVGGSPRGETMKLCETVGSRTCSKPGERVGGGCYSMARGCLRGCAWTDWGSDGENSPDGEIMGEDG